MMFMYSLAYEVYTYTLIAHMCAHTHSFTCMHTTRYSQTINNSVHDELEDNSPPTHDLTPNPTFTSTASASAVPCSLATQISSTSPSASLASIKSTYLPSPSNPSSAAPQTNLIKSLFTSVATTLSGARKSTTQLYTNYKLVSSIRSRYSTSPSSITYEEYSLMTRGVQDRWKILNVMSLLIFASDVAPYALMFYPKMLPSTFDAKFSPPPSAAAAAGEDGDYVPPSYVASLLASERSLSRSVVSGLLDLEWSCHNSPFLSTLNPFGKPG